MKKISFIQWFIRLVKRDAKEYEVDEQNKKKTYDSVIRKLKD